MARLLWETLFSSSVGCVVEAYLFSLILGHSQVGDAKVCTVIMDLLLSFYLGFIALKEFFLNSLY